MPVKDWLPAAVRAAATDRKLKAGYACFGIAGPISVSPAGEPFATLPPRVPRFWICTPPISRAAATSIGRRFCTSGDLAIDGGRIALVVEAVGGHVAARG